MLFLKKITITALALALVCNSAFAALVSFTADTKLDLNNPASTIYILDGSAADSITFNSDYTEATVGIPADSTFKVGGSSSNYLSVKPSGESVTLYFKDSYIDASGNVTTWKVNSDSSVSTTFQVSTPEANKNYKVFVNDVLLEYYYSGSDSKITFTNSVSGTQTYGFQQGEPPSGSSASSNSRSTSTVRLPSAGSGGSGTLGVSGAVSFSSTGGKVTRTIKLYCKENMKLTVEIPKNAKIRTADGKIYSGTIAAPKMLPNESITKSVSGGGSTNKVRVAITVDAPGQSVRFDKSAKITIPFEIAEVEDLEKLKVFYYDKRENKYKLAGNGGQLFIDREVIEVDVDHFTIFAVFETDAEEISLKNRTEIYKDVAGIPSKPAAGRIDFSDVESDSWFAAFVDELAGKEIISGYSDGTFQPEKILNRAEIAKIAATAFDLTISENLSENPFSDVSKDEWFAPFVAAAKEAGITSGYDEKISDLAISRTLKSGDYGEDVKELQTVLTELGFYQATISGYFGKVTRQAFGNFQFENPETHEADGWGVVGEATMAKLAELSGRQSEETRQVFRPTNSVNRAEALKILLAASGLEMPKKASFSKFSDVPHNAWFVRFVNFAEANEIVSGFSDGSFRPGDPVNRAEVSKIVSLLLDLKSKSSSTSVAIETPLKTSFWEKFSPKNLFSNLLGVFD